MINKTLDLTALIQRLRRLPSAERDYLLGTVAGNAGQCRVQLGGTIMQLEAQIRMAQSETQPGSVALIKDIDSMVQQQPPVIGLTRQAVALELLAELLEAVFGSSVSPTGLALVHD